MDHRFFRRGAALLLSGILSCCAAAITACGGDSAQSGSEVSVYMPSVPDSKVDENTPGEEIGVSIGKTVSYQDKVTVTLNKIVEFDGMGSTASRYFVAELTIENKTDTALDCSTLTHFTARLNGTEDSALVRDVTASVYARKYYTKTGSKLTVFNQAIAAGTSVEGYIYFSTPFAWDEMQLVYTPYKYYNTDKLLIDIKGGDITHFAEKL